MTPNTPNLFDHATSELSQDAFLAWILEWSDHRFRDENPDLHRAGQALLGELLGAKPPPRCRVRVRRQLEWVDLAVEVGDHHVLVIEDKTTSSVKVRGHRLALQDYADAIRTHYGSNRTSRFVYLKTGNEHPPSLPAEWSRFGRRQLLESLEPFTANARSDILRDFIRRMRRIEERTSAWKLLPAADWHLDAWLGFFGRIARPLGGEWNYQANARGGEYVLFWGYCSGAYLLIRVWPQPGADGRPDWEAPSGQLTVRMDIPSDIERRDLESILCATFPEMRPPKRRSPGRTVRVTESSLDFRTFDHNARIDIEATIAALQLWSRRLATASRDALLRGP